MTAPGPMRVLIADDEPLTRTKLGFLVQRWGFEAVFAADGLQAWEALNAADAPKLAILDWQMPGLTGDAICRKAREELREQALHIILLTATRLTMEEKVRGLGAGADDYLTKPFDAEELYARLQVGERIVALQEELRSRLEQLESALARVAQLQGLLPICMDCKRIRDDHNHWHQLERYIASHTAARFTHSLCPICFDKRAVEIEAHA